MSSTDAREQADGPVVPEPGAPGGVAEMSGPLVPARGGGGAARGGGGGRAGGGGGGGGAPRLAGPRRARRR
jgi:hypothetical protein